MGSGTRSARRGDPLRGRSRSAGDVHWGPVQLARWLVGWTTLHRGRRSIPHRRVGLRLARRIRVTVRRTRFALTAASSRPAYSSTRRRRCCIPNIRPSSGTRRFNFCSAPLRDTCRVRSIRAAIARSAIAGPDALGGSRRAGSGFSLGVRLAKGPAPRSEGDPGANPNIRGRRRSFALWRDVTGQRAAIQLVKGTWTPRPERAPE